VGVAEDENEPGPMQWAWWKYILLYVPGRAGEGRGGGNKGGGGGVFLNTILHGDAEHCGVIPRLQRHQFATDFNTSGNLRFTSPCSNNLEGS